MPYRGFDSLRMQSAMQNTMLSAPGQAVVWRQYTSGVTAGSASMAGYGDTDYYREQTITAFVGQWVLPNQPQAQQAAGMVTQGQFNIVAFAPIRKDDEITWRGQTYRVDSDPSPSVLVSGWQAILKRGGT